MCFTFGHFFLSFRDVCLLQQEVHRKEVMEAKFHQDTEEQKQKVGVYYQFSGQAIINNAYILFIKRVTRQFAWCNMLTINGMCSLCDLKSSY